MDRYHQARLQRDKRLADQLRASDAWQWHAEGIESEIAERIDDLATDTSGTFDQMRVSQGFIAGLRWSLEDPQRRGADASEALQEDDIDE